MSPPRREPPLDEVLDEPIVQMLMTADGVDSLQLQILLHELAQALRDRAARLAA